jgi:hypothetical protein
MPFPIRQLIARGYWNAEGEGASAGGATQRMAPVNSPEHDKTMAAIKAAEARGEDPFGDYEPMEVANDDDNTGVDDGTNNADEQGAAGEGEAGTPAAREGEEEIDAEALASVAGEDEDDDVQPFEVPDVDFKAERKKIDELEADIEAKWTDGHLTDEEKAAKLAPLREQREGLVRQDDAARPAQRGHVQHRVASSRSRTSRARTTRTAFSKLTAAEKAKLLDMARTTDPPDRSRAGIDKRKADGRVRRRRGLDQGAVFLAHGRRGRRLQPRRPKTDLEKGARAMRS